MLKPKTTAKPFALLFARANAAGVLVVKEKPAPALIVVPLKPVTCRLLDALDQVEEPFDPFR